MPRMPMLMAVVAVATGIVVDRSFSAPVPVAIAVGGAATLLAIALASRPKVSATAVTVALAAVGALRHHWFWTTRPTTDISRIDLRDDTPLRLEGVVESPIEIREANDSPATPIWMKLDRSSFNLRAERLIGQRDLPVTGLVRVDVTGHLLGVALGDRVDVLGHIRVPDAPRDPHGFDMRLWLKSQGIDRAMNVEHPDAVTRTEDASSTWHRIARLRQTLRDDCERMLATNLSASVRAVGTSLLLGTRTGLTDEIREAFINSGTMHVLAISGLHVGILAALVLAICRLLDLKTGWTVLVVLMTLAGYTFITDLRPPVLRSAILGCLLVAAVPKSRQTSASNLLAGTAFAMLLWNPVDLFDLGAQLSFLAVAAILWSAPLVARWSPRIWPELLDRDLTPAARSFRWILRKCVEGCFVTAAIWLFTLPLTLAWFRLVSPVGFLVNILLVPFSAPLLAAGFLTLVVGLLLPSLAWLPALVYDGCLRLLMFIVNVAAGTPLGHISAPAPAALQLIVYYALLTAAILLPFAAWRRRAWMAFVTAIAVMLGWSVRPRAAGDLVVTFIDVGHGGAVLFEFPGGETALFDAGSFGRGEPAAETIHRALEERRIASLNAIVLSHADSDHYNSAEGLLERLPVGVVYVSQAFPDMSQRSVAHLCETVRQHGVPLRLTQAGDTLAVSQDCTVEVLHPAGGFRDALDNAHSIVLRTRFAGKTVLVTGDVEKAGVRAMMESHPAEPIDVFQAPHHGGKMSNTTDLARWSRPRYVVACNRNDAVLPRLREVYADAERILTSASNGTVTATIRRTGELVVVAAREPRP